jgi:hypothetical protein
MTLPPPDHVRIVQVRPQEYAIGSWQNVLIVVFRGNPTEPSVRAMHLGMMRLVRSCPEGLAFLLVNESGAGIPEGKARDAAHAMFREMGEKFLGVAGVVEGAGFWAAAMRSVLSVAARMSQRAFPFRIFASAREAVAWLAITLATRRVTSTELEAALADVRARLGDAPPHAAADA